MTRQSRIYEDPVDSSLRNIGVIPVYDPPLEEMLRKRRRAGRRWPEGAGGDEEIDLNNPPSFIFLSNESVLESTPGAVIGVLEVIDADLPDDAHTFMVNDSRFEVVDGVLRLKAGQFLTFSVEPTVTVNVTATDRALAHVTVAFDIEVLPILIPVPPNSPPTDILLNNTTVEANTLGAPVGYLTVVDADLPDETHTWAVDDIRFVIAGTVLRLKPTEQISEATVDITITVTDSDDQSFQKTFTITPEVGGSPDLDNALYITPTGAGTLSGADWDNAGRLSSLNSFIAASAGRNILLRADAGTYTAALMNITAGGSVGAPAVIWGVDVNGVPLNTEILGVRQEPWVGGAGGTEVFRLLTGASNLWFRNIGFHNIGNGGFRIGADISNLTIDNCTGDNVQRFIENNVSGTNPTASVTNLIVRRSWARGYSRNFARTQYASTFLYEDCFGDSERQDGGNFAAGISFLGTASGTCRRCEMKNNIDIVLNTTSDYYNGDGFSTESGNNVVFEDCAASGNTDGGFDLKGTVSVLRCRAVNNKRNFRIWDTGTLTDCIGLDPRDQGDIFTQDQVWVASGGNCTVTGCSFADEYAEANVFELDAIDSTIVVTDTAVQTDGTETFNPEGGSATITTHAPPVNTVVPTITGTPTGGFVLTASTGTWAVGGLTFAYQWKRNDLYIDTATASEYVLDDDDVGQTITISVYATDADGDVGEATSAATATIATQHPVNTVLPSIIGPRVVGGTLTADPGTWTGVPAPTFTYQWRANGSDIVGATDVTYELTASEEGDNIDVAVTGDNGGGVPAIAISPATVPIVAAGGEEEFFIRATAHGLGDGTSFANAGAFSSLNGFIGGTAPGGTIYILATDVYTRTSVLTIDNGGTSGNPITIRGVTSGLVPSQATIRSNRTAWTLPTNSETVTSVGSWTVGSQIFRLNSGASHLIFEYLNFERVGNGCFLANAVISHVTVRDSAFYNVQRFWEMPDDPLAMNNITVQRITGVGFSECFMRIRQGAHTYLVEDCDVNSGRQNGDNFAMGIQWDSGSHDCIINRVIVRNCHDTVNSYWQGDGFASEGSNYNLEFNDCESYGCTDSGWDLKSATTVLNNCIAGDNKRNYRFWGGITANNCTSIEPNIRGGTGSEGHFFSFSHSNNYVILNSPILINTTGTVTFDTETGSQMWVKNADLTAAVGSDDVDSGSTLIYFNGADVTAPTVSGPHDLTLDDLENFSRFLVASEPVMWKIIGGADAALFSRDYRTLSMAAKENANPIDADADNVYVVTVNVLDAGETSVNQTFNITVRAPRWTPNQLGSARRGWWRADDLADGAVPNWISTGGTSLFITGSPSKSSTSFNSAYGGVVFDGVDDCFTTTSLSAFPLGSTPGEMWAVVDATGAGAVSRRIVQYGSSGSNQARFISHGSTGAASVNDGTVGLTDSDNTDFNGYSIIGGYYTGVAIGGRRDGRDFEPAATALSGAVNTLDNRLRIGATNGGTPSALWKGQIRHVLITTALTAGEREQVEGFLAWDSGLESLLPVSHPYKSAAP